MWYFDPHQNQISNIAVVQKLMNDDQTLILLFLFKCETLLTSLKSVPNWDEWQKNSLDKATNPVFKSLLKHRQIDIENCNIQGKVLIRDLLKKTWVFRAGSPEVQAKIELSESNFSHLNCNDSF